MLAENENIYIVFVGSGPQLHEYSEQVEKASMEKNIKFIGPVSPDDVPLYYSLGDVFTIASRSETQGLTYIEAVASGLPLLVFFDDSLQGVFEDEKNGFSFNSAAEFSRAVQLWQGEPALLREMSETAIASSKRFAVESFAEQILAIYESQIERQAGREKGDLGREFSRS